jgi:gluconolactonase
MKSIAQGLGFPEGPIWLADGSVLVVELRNQCLTRVMPDGRKIKVASFEGSPNGAAMGPDGACYVCNNGGMRWAPVDNVMFPVGQPQDYVGGRIERVDLATGEVSLLYSHCGDHALRGPNDLVFDSHGGLWFTDQGKRRERDGDRGGIYYARADGTMIVEAVFPTVTPNGIGLSPDEKTLYMAETDTCRLWAFDVESPGRLRLEKGPLTPYGGRMLYAPSRYSRFDSLAVEENGCIVVATLAAGGLSVISPQGELVEFIAIPGEHTVTNLCFGGPELNEAYITAASRGELLRMDWKRKGLRLAYQ